MSASSSAVTAYELAVLVLNYLESNSYQTAARSFRREARLVLGDAASTLPPGVRSLHELLNDYVGVRERDARRQALAGGNPIAQSLYSLLDFHAGLPTPKTLPPLFYTAPLAPPAPPPQPAPLPHPLQQQPQQQYEQQPYPEQRQQQEAGGGLAGMIPVQAADLTYVPPGPCGAEPLLVSGAAAAADQQTPGRHALRKGAPRKRRKLEDSFDLHTCAGFGASGPYLAQGGEPPAAGEEAAGAGFDGARGLDLLNMPLDEEGLLLLLCDADLQNRFASGLAQHITTAMNHLPGAQGTAGPSGGGEDALFAGSIEEVLAELPADPNMAQLLQQFVRVEGPGAGGSSLSSPPGSRPGSAACTRPGSGGRERRRPAGHKQPGREGAPSAAPSAPAQSQRGEEQVGSASTAAAGAAHGPQAVADLGHFPGHALDGRAGQQQAQQEAALPRPVTQGRAQAEQQGAAVALQPQAAQRAAGAAPTPGGSALPAVGPQAAEVAGGDESLEEEARQQAGGPAAGVLGPRNGGQGPVRVDFSSKLAELAMDVDDALLDELGI